MRLGLDIGGAISKYPDVFRDLVDTCSHPDSKVTIFVVSDMHDHAKMVDMLQRNKINVPPERIISADYKTHGELCKAVVCDQHNIDMLIDDFPGYVGARGRPKARLLVMPDPHEPYYDDSWQTDGSEGDFGRRKRT